MLTITTDRLPPFHVDADFGFCQCLKRTEDHLAALSRAARRANAVLARSPKVVCVSRSSS